jgi:hypothetical protein
MSLNIWRGNKKVRIGVILALLAAAAYLLFLAWGKKLQMGIIGAVIVVLLGALGMEVGETDYDMGALIRGDGLAGSKIIRDEVGNINFDGVSPLVANCESNEYNCSDFTYQAQAQDVMDRCGGKGKDINGLDGDKDGRACESLPKNAPKKK